MSLLAGYRSAAPPQLNDEQVWRLLARQHPAAGNYASATVRHADGLSLGVTGPGAFAASARFAVVAEARLDDRRGLCDGLARTQETGDAALILAAWERWGTQTPQHLYGDYAFAVWDIAQKALFLVRDALGQRPLFFLSDGSAFASRADAFDVLDARHGAPSETALAAYLGFVGSAPASFYAGVERVLPGELVSIVDGGVVRSRWWRPSTKPDHRRGPADSVAECRSLLEAAVRDRLADAPAAIATHLSAGLDSSVATALAAELKPAATALHAFTAIPTFVPVDTDRFADEGAQAALAAASLPGVEHHRVAAVDDPLAYLADAASLYQQPLPNPHNHGWTAAINDAARAAGAQLLLVGQTGNYSFSMAGDPRGRAMRAARTLLRRLRPRPSLFPLLAPGAATLTATDPLPPGGAERRLYFLLRLDPGAMFAGMAARWGLATRDPFADRRLAEFSLTIPDRTLVALGDRGLGRPVAAGLLPGAFVNNRARGYQSIDWIDRLRRHAPRVRAMIARHREHGLLKRLLTLDAVAEAAERLETATAPTPADERLYRVDLPRALAAMAFAGALAEPVSRCEAMAWQGTKL